MHYFQKLNETQNFSLSHMQLTYAEKLQTNKYCQILSRAINLCVTPLTLLIDAVAHVIIGTVAVCGLSQAGLLINFIAQKNNLSWRSPITFSKGYVHLFKGCTHFASILVLPVLGCLSPTIGIYYATMIQLFFAKPKNTAYSRNEEILKGKIEKRPQITDFQQISDILSQSNLMNKKKCERLKIPSKNQKIILLKKNLLKFNNCFSTIQSVFTNLVLKQSLLDIDAISNIENTLNNLKNCKILKDISVGNIDNTTMFYEIQNFYKNFADQIKLALRRFAW